MRTSTNNRLSEALRRLLRQRWVLFLALVCVIASLIAASCGSNDNDASIRDTGPINPNVLTRQEIGRYPNNTPQRALLIWFQAVQFRDQGSVRLNTTRREVRRVRPKALENAVSLVGSSLGKPKIVSIRNSGTKATVRVFVQSYLRGEPKPVLEVPRTFSLARSGGKWQVDDVRYLLESSAAILAQKRKSA